MWKCGGEMGVVGLTGTSSVSDLCLGRLWSSPGDEGFRVEPQGEWQLD